MFAENVPCAPVSPARSLVSRVQREGPLDAAGGLPEPSLYGVGDAEPGQGGRFGGTVAGLGGTVGVAVDHRIGPGVSRA